MNTTAKILPLAPANAEEELTRLRRRLGELDTRRNALTRLLIEAEKTVGAPGDHFNSDLAQAEALLDGKKFIPSREKPLSTTAALRAERDAIDAALKIGRSREHRLAEERAVAIWASHFAEIAKIEKHRIALAIELQLVNRAREKLREKILAEGGAGCFATDGVDLLGFVDSGDDVHWAAQRLIADQICSRSEIEKAISDG
jgi:hypothetical protein